jgi:hypothetical protein
VWEQHYLARRDAPQIVRADVEQEADPALLGDDARRDGGVDDHVLGRRPVETRPIERWTAGGDGAMAIVHDEDASREPLREVVAQCITHHVGRRG